MSNAVVAWQSIVKMRRTGPSLPFNCANFDCRVLKLSACVSTAEIVEVNSKRPVSIVVVMTKGKRTCNPVCRLRRKKIIY